MVRPLKYVELGGIAQGSESQSRSLGHRGNSYCPSARGGGFHPNTQIGADSLAGIGSGNVFPAAWPCPERAAHGSGTAPVNPPR